MYNFLNGLVALKSGVFFFNQDWSNTEEKNEKNRLQPCNIGSCMKEEGIR